MGMLDQMKQAMQMRRETKKIQAEIDKISYTHTNAGITVTVKGDFSVTQLKITEEALAEVKAGKPDRFETMMKTVLNAAISHVKAQTQQVMQQMMKDGNGPFGR